MKSSYITIATSTAGYTANDCDYLCNGTDDSTVIDRAISFLNGTTKTGKILFLDGTYNISSFIQMSLINNVTIEGQGASTIFKKTKALNKEIFMFIACNNLKIKNILIDGASIADSNYSLLKITSSNNILISGCFFTGGAGNSTAIEIGSLATLTDEQDKCSNVIITNNKLYNMISAEIQIGQYCTNCIITKNSAINTLTSQKSYISSHAENSIISDNYLSAKTAQMVCLQNQLFVNNKVISTDDPVVNYIIRNGPNILFTKNTAFKNSTGSSLWSGVFAEYADRCLISNNMLMKGTGLPSDYSAKDSGMSTSRCSKTLIINNMLMGKDIVVESASINTDLYFNKWS